MDVLQEVAWQSAPGMHPGALTPVAINMRRLVEQGQGLLAAVAGPRLHDQVLPNTTFAEAWSAGAASFFVSPQEIEVRSPALLHAVLLEAGPEHS